MVKKKVQQAMLKIIVAQEMQEMENANRLVELQKNAMRKVQIMICLNVAVVKLILLIDAILIADV